jgi:hypothetical protein
MAEASTEGGGATLAKGGAGSTLNAEEPWTGWATTGDREARKRARAVTTTARAPTPAIIAVLLIRARPALGVTLERSV